MQPPEDTLQGEALGAEEGPYSCPGGMEQASEGVTVPVASEG